MGRMNTTIQIALPNISGSPTVGVPLTIAPPINLIAGIVRSIYANGTQVATGDITVSYTPVSADIGKTFTIVDMVPNTSKISGVCVAAPATKATINMAPMIVGTPTVGTPLSITAGTFIGGAPAPTVTRVIYAGGTQVATGSTYVPVTADIGKVFTVDDIATNSAGATHNMSMNSAACVVTPAGTDQRMFASNRTEIPAGLGIPATVGTLWQVDAVSFVMPNYDQNTPIFTWPGFYVFGSTNEVACSNDIPIRNAYLEVNGVVTAQFKFGGSTSGTVVAGSYLSNDPDASMVLPANAIVRVRTQTLLTVGQYRLTSYVGQTAYDGQKISGQTNLDDFTSGVTAIPAASLASSLYGPCVFTALGWSASTKPPVPLIVGDSIGYRHNDGDGLTAVEGVFGYVNRAMVDTSGPGRFTYGNFCAPGTRLEGLAPTPFSLRSSILNAHAMPFSCIYMQMGINTPQSSRISAWESIAGPYVRGLAGSKRIIGGTLLPQASIANGTKGTVLADMTAMSNVAWNTYLKGNSRLYFDAIVDNTSAFESAPGSGVYAVPAFTTTIATDFVSGSAFMYLVDKPDLQMSLIVAPGANSLFGKTVTAVSGTGPYKVSVPFSFTGTYPAGTVVAATNTLDGTHPATLISIAGKAPLVAAKAAGVFASPAVTTTIPALPLRMVMVSGQSLSIGLMQKAQQPAYPVQPEVSSYMKMFNGVPASGLENVAVTDANTTSLVQYQELTGVDGGQGYYTHGTGFLKTVDASDTAGQQWLWAPAGMGGTTITQLDSGGNVASFANQQKMLANAKVINPNADVSAILFSQGEANYADATPDVYTAKFITYRANQLAAVAAQFPNSAPKFLIDQCGDGMATVRVHSAQANMARTGLATVVGPKYWLNRKYPDVMGSEQLHLNVIGYTYQGEMFGRALTSELLGTRFKPTMVNTVEYVNSTTIKLKCSTPNGGSLVIDTSFLPACPGNGISAQRPDLTFAIPTSVTVSGTDVICVFAETIYPDYRITIGYTATDITVDGLASGNYMPMTNIRGSVANASNAGLAPWYDWLLLDRHVMLKTDVGYVKPGTLGVELWRSAQVGTNVPFATAATFDGTNMTLTVNGTTNTPVATNTFVSGQTSLDTGLWFIKTGRTYRVTVGNVQVTSGAGAHEIRITVGGTIIKRQSTNSGTAAGFTVDVVAVSDGNLSLTLNNALTVGSISGISVKEVL
jgi:hypothetical protein